ncbi:ABC transporter substrate-binding protein [Pseudobacteriovorax antillogorgiicola]|uniref:Amino acid/amide ABC transporter substrate-binding protein, HAAT family n=1 Tax=Pseudobacteriovorax antillogorgiicola TaxID=1513793 RepID=A0A1Y6BXH8_9BACT|nr:ABC transporter substrate-binding protein [Pseudobacteriovorax antillogorgiicola]TCS50311.1 amino acid/amide ABC transporter substrate-binding protein (HAAT family) [Pseudobacteriovorax antillogorgiicola]SMF34107.1 amino acid/amide ABC transporter substrate-binding protein, HAAT family [Pseudobacteriovorax antillogorgiicola]
MVHRCLALLTLALITSPTNTLAVNAKLKIGVVRPKSGPMSPIGDELMNGIQVAFDKISESKNKGLAPSIQIIQEDDGGKGSTAMTATQRLIDRHRVHILIGSISNTINHSIAEVASRKNRLLILPIGTDTDLMAKGKNVFSISLTESQQGSALGKFAKTVLKKDKALILEEQENPYSQALASSFVSRFKKIGGTEAQTLSYKPNNQGFQNASNKASQIDHDVVFIPGFYFDASSLMKQFRQKGMEKIFIGGDGWDTYGIKEAFGPELSGHYYYTPYSVQDPHPALQRFVRSFEKKFKKSPSIAAFAGYEAFNLAVYAYKRVKSNRTSPLESFLRKARKLPSLTGPMRMNSSRSPNKPATIMVTTPQGSQYMTKVTP